MAALPPPPQIMLVYDVRRSLSAPLFTDILATKACQAVVLYDSAALDEAAFQKAAEALAPLIQSCGLPALIAENSSLCGRLQADGLHMEEQTAESPQALAAMRQKYGKKRLLGYGNPQSRHQALLAGEQQPDYMFFGKLGKDKKPAAHPRNRALAAWWAEVARIDCVLQAGGALEHLAELRAVNADFIALEEAVFSAADPQKALLRAQAILAEPA